MLKRLKKKFIFINMLTVSLILIVIFIAICIFAFRLEQNLVFRSLDSISDKVVALYIDNKADDELSQRNDGFLFNVNLSLTTKTSVINGDGEIVLIYRYR